MFNVKKFLLLIIFIVLILALTSCSLGSESDFYEIYELKIKAKPGVSGYVYLDGENLNNEYCGWIGPGIDMIWMTIREGSYTIYLYKWQNSQLIKKYNISIYSDKTFYLY